MTEFTKPHKSNNSTEQRHRKPILATLFCACCLSGCVVGPNFQQPPTPFLNSNFTVQSSPDLETDRLASWWNTFSDPMLTELLSEAEAENLNLETAYHRILEARAQLALATGSLRPNGDFIAAYSYRQRSLNADPFVGPNGSPFNLYDVGVLSSWELDFFGRIKRTIESASAEACFSESDHDHVRLTLLSDVATSYFRIRWLQQQMEVTRESLAVQSETLKLVEKRAGAGLSNDLDVAQANAFKHRTLATLPSLERQMQVEFNRLNVLLGQTPGTTNIELVGNGALPAMPDLINVGIPANLLRNRPDIQRQEHAVAAASANVGIATTDLYPRFSLFGEVSVRAKTVSSMFETAGLAFNVGPSFSWNLFNFARVNANIEANKERFHQSVAVYQQTVLDAIREVEDAMISQVGFSAEAEAMTQAIEHDKTAVELSLQRYLIGKTNFQRVMDSQQQLLQDQQRKLNAHAQSLIQLVGIYKSVGGGWDPVTPTVFASSVDGFDHGAVIRNSMIPTEALPRTNADSDDNTFHTENVGAQNGAENQIRNGVRDFPSEAQGVPADNRYNLWLD